MALTRPLRGIRYDTGRVDLGRVLAPPYDVIGEAQRERLYAADPHNIVRVDFGRDEPGDVPDSNDRYTRARDLLVAWRREGVLRQDPDPACYVHDHVFTGIEGARRRRRGLIVGVRALPWGRSDVLPHEHTLRGPKEDRLRLLRATRHQTSAVLLMWDRAPGAAELLAAAADGAPDATAVSDGEVAAEEHRLWAVNDPGEVAGIVEALGSARLYMADGHHRFETAAAHAAERRAAEPAASDDADFAWTLAYLCAADDEALEVLPTHRLVLPGPGVPATLGDLLPRVPPRWLSERTGSLEAAVAAAAGLQADHHAVALAAADGAALLVARRDPAASPRDRLDVSAVESDLLAAACGLDAERIAGGALIYVRRVAEAAEAVTTGRAALAICVNPCTTRQIIDVSDAGEQMPQKSTYFYPKVPTGLVLGEV